MEIIKEKHSEAEKRRRRILRDWITYMVICSFLSFVNWMTSPHYWWVLWVIAGWGVGLLLRTIFLLTGLDEQQDR